jgi:hypothetical protein
MASIKFNQKDIEVKFVFVRARKEGVQDSNTWRWVANAIHTDTITVPIELEDGCSYGRSGSSGEVKNPSYLPGFESRIV